MSTPTEINEEYDIIIAGGEPSSSHPLLFQSLLTEGAFGRRYYWLRRRRSSCSGGSGPSHPHTRGGPLDV